MLRENLRNIPKDLYQRRALLAGETGLLLHEVGHLTAAALRGIPSDFIIFDLKSEKRHACYMRPEYNIVFENNSSLYEEILSAGFLAEAAIFNEVAVSRSESDLQAICRLKETILSGNSQRTTIVNANREKYKRTFYQQTRNILMSNYVLAYEAYKSKKNLIDNAIIIPFHKMDLRCFNGEIETYQDAISRSKDENHKIETLKCFRAAQEISGI